MRLTRRKRNKTREISRTRRKREMGITSMSEMKMTRRKRVMKMTRREARSNKKDEDELDRRIRRVWSLRRLVERRRNGKLRRTEEWGELRG